MRLTFNQKRLMAGVLLLVYAPIMANSFFELGFLGRYDRVAMAVAAVVMVVFLFRFAPTLEEVREHRDKLDRERYGRLIDRRWHIVPVAVVAMLFVLFALGTGGRIVRGESLEQEDWWYLIGSPVLFLYIGIRSWRQARRPGDQRKG